LAMGKKGGEAKNCEGREKMLRQPEIAPQNHKGKTNNNRKRFEDCRKSSAGDAMDKMQIVQSAMERVSARSPGSSERKTGRAVGGRGSGQFVSTCWGGGGGASEKPSRRNILRESGGREKGISNKLKREAVH